MTPRRQTLALATLIGALTTIVLAARAPEIGFVRDEGIYFDASRRYGQWLGQLAESPAKALSARARDRAFAHNREHPPLMKLAAAASAQVLGPSPARGETARTPEPARTAAPNADGWLTESAAMRLPAQLLTGLGAALLFLIGAGAPGRNSPAERRWACGVVAAAFFVFAPRVAFHGSLHAFDVPIAVATLMLVLCYRRGRSSWRWSLVTGVVFGLAILVKHNALFVPALFLAHHAWTLWRARRNGASIGLPAFVPPVFVSMAIMGPLVAFAGWPWLWSDPVARLDAYVEFHAHHSYYNMEFLGVNYNRPPLPMSYPGVMTVATISTSLLAVAVAGLFLGPRSQRPGSEPGSETDSENGSDGADDDSDDSGAWTNWSRWEVWHHGQPADWTRRDRGDRELVALFAAFPLVLIALPTIPIFGGTKHWLTAYPFLAWAAAWAWAWVGDALPKHAPPLARPGAFALVTAALVTPAGWSTVHAHPQGLSQYSAAVGGPRGAAQMGLNRGYWGHAIGPLLDDAAAPPDARPRPLNVYAHDIHALAVEQYRRDGRWPAHWRPSTIARARAAFLFHERHMVSDEVRIWNALGTTRPKRVVTLDDVPLTSWYAIE